jgi:putative ABC transport system permease protein
MGALWYKLWHDLWQHKGRTTLAILSVAAGLFAIGTVFGLVDQLLAGMDAAHHEVAPSHINVILRSYVDDDIVAGVRALPGVAGVDPANQISVRYRTGSDDRWQLGNVVMRPAYDAQQYDHVILKEGSWPTADSIGIERLSSQFYAIDIGDEVVFDVAGRELTFPVGGKIRHPFVQPPPFGGQAHFFADAATLAALGLPEGRYGQLLVRVTPYSEAHARDVAAAIRAYLGSQGANVAVNIYQDPDRHWGRMFVEGITVVLRVMAVVSLFLSVILILTTATALITQQTNQIGVLKAIGGRRTTIAQIYLFTVLTYGLVALLLALPLGALAAFAASHWFLNLFNIDYDLFQVSTRALTLQVIAAVLAPLLAALWPVLKGTAMTVREALSTYGLGSDFGSGVVERAVDAFAARFMPTLYATALTNMVRRKERLLLTLLVLITAGVMFLVVLTLVSSTNLTLDNEMARRGYDVRVGFSADQDSAAIADQASTLPGIASLDFLYSKNATMLVGGERAQDSAGLGAQLVGLSPAAAILEPVIVRGRWLQPEDTRAVVVSEESAVVNAIDVGDEISLDLGLYGASAWTVVGTYNVIYEGGFTTEAIYAPLATMQAATGNPDRVSQLFIRLDDARARIPHTFADELRTLFEEEGIKVDLYTTAVKVDERAYLDNQFNTVVFMLLGLAALMATVGGIGLMGSLSISVIERRREIGVLRAIGASSSRVLSVFLLEGMMQGFVSWLVAVPLAFLFSQPMARLLGQTMMELDLDYRFNLLAVAIWLVAVLILAAIASFGPARHATHLSVRHSLAYE